LKAGAPNKAGLQARAAIRKPMEPALKAGAPNKAGLQQSGCNKAGVKQLASTSEKLQLSRLYKKPKLCPSCLYKKPAWLYKKPTKPKRKLANSSY
jgi:hypothetical protein